MREPKKPPRAAADQPITADCIRELLANRVLRRFLEMPGEPEIAKLAQICEGWRQRCAIERELAPIAKQQANARTALENWQKELDGLRQSLDKLSQKAMSDGDRIPLLRHLTAIDATRQLAARAESAGYLNRLTYGWVHWGVYAPALAQDLHDALQPANPNAQIELKPVARFLAALAPLLTGERLQVTSVETQLKIMRQKKRRETAG